MKFLIHFKKKNILIKVKRTNFISKCFGLTFKTRNTSNLLFEFNKPVTWRGNLTSWFVFFPFLTLWLDDKNNVIDTRVVEPFIFSISQKKEFYKIIELPFNLSNRKLIESFKGKKEFLRYLRS